MKKTIDKKVYNTEKDTHLGQRFAGEFGTPSGFEEPLFVTKHTNIILNLKMMIR